jgi:hypothetical protein
VVRRPACSSVSITTEISRTLITKKKFGDPDVAQEVSRGHQASPCGICCDGSGTRTHFARSTSAFPCQCRRANIPFSVTHPPRMLYKVLPYHRPHRPLGRVEV